jgi:cephalosporin hydroxylase
VAHGGSLIFHASLCKLLGRGRVIGVDIEIRPHNRAAIEAHPLKPLITLVEGSSTDAGVVRGVKELVAPEETALIVLDSSHASTHVLAELEAYAPLVTPGSYIIAMDGHLMELAAGSGGGAADWRTNNPNTAVRQFVRDHPEFVAEELPLLFNESALTRSVTGFRGGVLKRIR